MDNVVPYVQPDDDEELTLNQQLGKLVSPDEPPPVPPQATGQMTAPAAAGPGRQMLTQQMQTASSGSAPIPFVDAPNAMPTRTPPAAAPGQQTPRDLLAQLGKAPEFDTQKYQDIMARRQQIQPGTGGTDATPINPLQQQYQPGTGGKILRGVRAWFGGGLPAVLDPKTYNAPNLKYGIDEGQRQARVANDDAQAASLKTGFDEQAKGYDRKLNTLKDVTTLTNNEEKNALRDQYNEAMGNYRDSQAALAAARAQNVKAPMPKTAEEALAFAANTNDPTLKQTYLGLSKSMAAMKIHEASASRPPREGNPVFNQWLTAFKQDNGRAPKADEISDWQGKQAGAQRPKPISPALAARISKTKDDAVNKARKEFLGEDHGRTGDMETYKDAWQGAQNEAEAELKAATGQDVEHLDIRERTDKDGNWIGAKPRLEGAQAPSTAASSVPLSAVSQHKSTAAAPPNTHSFSKSNWQKANPKGDINAAVQQAKRLGYSLSE